MKTKICIKCNQEKSLNDFHFYKNKTGSQSYCKKCISLIMKEHRHNNKKKIKPNITEKKCCKCGIIKNIEHFHQNKSNKDGYQNRCKVCQCLANKESKNIHKDRVLIYNKNYRKIHQNESRLYRKHKLETNIQYKLALNCRKRVKSGLKGKFKFAKTIELIGCSWKFLKEYLESKFTEGMTWENYGKWHIDHIKPLSSFDLTQESEQKAACHYTNLQPLWAEDNYKKSNKII